MRVWCTAIALAWASFACSVGGRGSAGSGGEAPGADTGALDAGVPPEPDAASDDDASAEPAQDADAGTVPEDGGSPPEDAGPAPDSGGEHEVVREPGPNDGWIGGWCASDADCAYPEAAGGLCLTEAQGWPGGTCSLPCDRLCPDREGPGVSVTFCISGAGGDGRCVSRCDYDLFDGGCREGYGCASTARHGEPGTAQLVCLPEDMVDPGAGPGQCFERALGLGLQVQPAPQRNDHPEGRPDLTCAIEEPLWLSSPVAGVGFRYWYDDAPGRMFMACPLALALQRLGELMAAMRVVEVVHIGTYNCRSIAGSDSLSMHGLAMAIDLGAFRLADGSYYTVVDDWETLYDEPVTPGGRFLHDVAWAMHTDRIFNIVLTPEYNDGHADHFHVDLTPGSHFLGKPARHTISTFAEAGVVD